MQENNQLVQNRGRSIRYLRANVENGNDGFEKAAQKLGCKPEFEDLCRVIRIILASPTDADRMIKRLEQNQASIEKRAKKMAMKKSAQRKMQEAENLANDPKTVLERQLQSITQKIQTETLGIQECEAKLQTLAKESCEKKNEAESLKKRLTELLKEIDSIEVKAIQCDEELRHHQDVLLGYDEEALRLKGELADLATVHICIGAPLEGCKPLEEMEVDSLEVKKRVTDFVMAPEKFPTEFLEFVEIATVEELRTVAKAMLVADKLTAENNGQKTAFHSSGGSSNVTALLEFAGYTVIN